MFLCFGTLLSSQTIVNEIASISETECDSYFPICFLRDGDHYNVSINKKHWYWRHYTYTQKDVTILIDEMVRNLEKIKKECQLKQATNNRAVLLDECANYLMYLNHFYDKIDIKNRRRYRNI